MVDLNLRTNNSVMENIMTQTIEKVLAKTFKDKSKTIQCDLCGHHQFKPHLDCGEFHYVQCNQCGLVLQNPQPDFNEISNLYDDSYFEYEKENHHAFYNLMKLSLNDIDFNTITSHLKDEKRVLDIGCATGLLLNDLQNEGWTPYGVEICEASARYGREHFNLNIQMKTLEECHFQENYFDIVHFSHLIEHVPSPSNLLKEVNRILKPGGYAIITTPNFDGLFAKIYKDKWRSAIAQHLYLFTKKTLSQLIVNNGFTIKKQVSWGGIPIELAQGPVKRMVDKWVKFLNQGDVMLFLAQKP